VKASEKGTQPKWILPAAMGLVLLAAAATTRARPPQEEDWSAPDAAKKVKNPVPVTAASMAAGKAIYKNNCELCHGDMGKGDGPDGDLYDPAPADFTNAKMMQGMTDGELFYKITQGRRPMPSFKNNLNDTQRWQAVNYIRIFSKK
jgi:mono/diheme cytochrome c family protein